jgi:hypothetical protein
MSARQRDTFSFRLGGHTVHARGGTTDPTERVMPEPREGR